MKPKTIEERVKEKLKGLMSEKRCKQLADNLEMFSGKRECTICGSRPEEQRKMVIELSTKAIMDIIKEERRRTIDFMKIDAPIAVKTALERILKNGHGGGNWRRLIMSELELLNPKPL